MGSRRHFIPDLWPFQRLCGTYTGFEAGGQKLFWQTTPPKKVVFFNQSWVLGLFLGNRYSVFDIRNS
jgi:hypothetical protein